MWKENHILVEFVTAGYLFVGLCEIRPNSIKIGRNEISLLNKTI